MELTFNYRYNPGHVYSEVRCVQYDVLPGKHYIASLDVFSLKA